MKNRYESISILKGNFTKEEYKRAFEIIKKYFERFENIEIEEIGKKKLAYEIKGEKEGYYILVNFMAKKEDIIEIERFYRINDDVMKFMTVRKEN